MTLKNGTIFNLPSADGIRAAVAVVPGKVITEETMKSKVGSFDVKNERGLEL